MEIESLSLQQLSVLKSQLEEEIEKLTNSFAQLRHASTKYRASRIGVENLEGKEILVPLTASLYVPGVVLDPDYLLVDVGTGYFVEKNRQQAIEFCDRKLVLLRENMNKLGNFINQRRRSLEIIIQTLQRKSN